MTDESGMTEAAEEVIDRVLAEGGGPEEIAVGLYQAGMRFS